MPALETDRLLKLDPADHASLLAARIAERDATILANDAERKRARAAKDAKPTKPAEDAKTAALTTATTEEGKFAAKVAEVKVKHAATDVQAADEGHDIARGAYVMKAGPLLSGLAPIEDKRLKVPDADCDAWVASYRASVRAGFEAFDLQRQINEYEAAHPKIDGEPGKLIPEPEALLALRAALKAQQDVARAEQAKQGVIFAATLAAAGERVGDYSYVRMGTEGEIVLGHNPLLTKNDKVVLEPAGDGEKLG
jgi:hypothetical protein